MSSKDERDYSPELEWIRFREDTLGEAAYQETSGDKLTRKIKENPFVPLGKLTEISQSVDNNV
jgi:hypothetical protein